MRYLVPKMPWSPLCIRRLCIANTIFLAHLYQTHINGQYYSASMTPPASGFRQRLTASKQMFTVPDNCLTILCAVTDTTKKDQLYALIRSNPFISQQDLASELGLSRSAVAGHIAGLIRERRLLGRAYVLPDSRPVLCIGAANLDCKIDRKSTRLNSSHTRPSRMPSSA